MVYRKGELTKSAIDRDWPHQVALPTPISFHWDIQRFCRGMSLCRRTIAFYRDGVHYACFCFADQTDAETFRTRFGGEFIDPKERPRWPGRQGSSKRRARSPHDR